MVLRDSTNEKKKSQFHAAAVTHPMELIYLIIIGVGVMQLPLLLDLAKSLFPSLRMARYCRCSHQHLLTLYRWTDRSLSLLLVFILFSLCVLALAIFFVVFLPVILRHYSDDDEVLLVVVSNVLFCFFLL